MEDRRNVPWVLFVDLHTLCCVSAIQVKVLKEFQCQQQFTSPLLLPLGGKKEYFGEMLSNHKYYYIQKQDYLLSNVN